MKRGLAAALILLLILPACLAAGCAGGQDEKVPFELNVLPGQLKGNAIPGQKICYLVTITESGKTGNTPVMISASAEGAEIVINHKEILSGEVAEVVVTPDPGSAGKTLQVKISGQRGEMKDDADRTFEVIEGEDDRNEYASELQARFVKWLAEKHPELKISAETVWTGTMVSPQWLVVSHYLFFSDEWEMHIEWHIMIAPDDWARIDLRHRYDETKPSYCFEISSVDGQSVPAAIEVPPEVWR